MEGIEISFPLSICRDIVEKPERQEWRFYKASISSGKKDGKKTLGALRTRVTPSDDDHFVDLILAFPRHTIKCPAVRGNLRCRAEILKNVSEAHESDEKAQVCHETGNEADDSCTGRDETKCTNKTKSKSPQTTKKDTERFSDETTIDTGRPSRRREKPSKFKDFVASAEPSKSAREKAEKEDPISTQQGIGASHELFASDRYGETDYISIKRENIRERLDKSYHSIAAQQKPGKRVVRKYDKLIKNLQQASARSGLEMLSVISGFKTIANPENVYADVTRSARPGSALYLYPNEKEQAGKGLPINPDDPNDSDASDKNSGQQISGSRRSSLGNKAQTARMISSSRPSRGRKKYPGIVTSQRKLIPRTNPYLSSFPRKFPSSLTRTDVLGISLAKTQKASPHKRQSAAVDSPGQSRSKYKKPASVRKLAGARDNEEGFLDDDNDEDYLPLAEEGEHSDPDFELGKKSKRSRSTQPQKRKAPESVAMVTVGGAVTQNQSNPVLVSLPAAQKQGKVSTALTGPTRKVKQASNDGRPSQPGSSAVKKGRPVVAAMADHDYTDIRLGRKVAFSNKALRTLVRPISLTRHISARVERVEEGEGSSLVTISGLNSKAAGGCPSHNLSLRLNHEGLPIADTLEDVMTDTFKRREKHLQSLQQAETASVNPEVLVDVDDMPTLNEVVLTPSGHQQPFRTPRAPRGRPRKYPMLKQSLSPAASSLHLLDGHDVFLQGAKRKGQRSAKTVTLQMTQAGWKEVEGGWGKDANKEELIQQGLIGVGFQPGQEISIDSVTSARSPEETVIENEEEVLNAQQSLTTKFCKYCLRMFPAAAILLKHVKTVHGDCSESAEHQRYLETLRRDVRMVCPFCPGLHTLSNEYKLRNHLAHYHGDQADVDLDLGEVTLNSVSPQCEVCQVHFHTVSELKAHATLMHNTHLFACSQCPAVFVRDTSLSDHVKEAHAGQSSRSFVCKTCDSTFDSKQLFLAHKQMVHSQHLKQLRAETTEAVTSNLSGVPHTDKSTQLLHAASKDTRSSGKQVKCPCCDAHFSHSWQLQDHRRQVHGGPVPVHCVFCGLGYQSLTPMYNHLRHHLQGNVDGATKSPTLLSCPFCDSATAFREASVLVSHVVGEHQSLFPFVCSICHQRFISEVPLHVHLQQAHELTVAGKMYSLLPGVQVPSTSAENLDGSSSLLNAADSHLNPASSSEESAVNPAPEETNSDVFLSLPEEAQQSIRLITQLGKRAVLTITDGKGNVQKVSFKSADTISTSSKAASPPLPAYDMQDIECSETVVEDGIALGSDVVLDGTPSVVENLVYGMNFSTETQVPTGASEMDSASEMATEELVAGDLTEAIEVSEEAQQFGVAMETEVNSDAVGVATEMEVVTESVDVNRGIPSEEGSDAAVEYEFVSSEMTGTPTQFVLVREREGRGEDTETQTLPASVREETETAVHASDDGTITVSADDLLKLIRASQSK